MTLTTPDFWNSQEGYKPPAGDSAAGVTSNRFYLAQGASAVPPTGVNPVDETLTIGRYADQDFAGDDWTLSATGLVCAQRGYLKGVELLSGTGVTLLLQDSPDVVAGRQIWQIPATSAPRRWDFPKPLPFHTGLFATIGGTSPSVKFILGGSE